MNLQNKTAIIGISILIALFFTVLFGMPGLRTFLGIVLFFFLPFYLMLNKLDLKQDEKVIFSLFIGLGMYSAFVYLSALFIGSIRIAMAVVFVILVLVSFLIGKKRFPKNRRFKPLTSFFYLF